jgi:hypothetical protein
MTFKHDFKQLQLPACPKCKERAVTVLSSKQTEASQRRRKQCSFCNYRFTTHEVSERQFQEAQKALVTLQKFKQFFNVTDDPEVVTEVAPVTDDDDGKTFADVKCTTCTHSHRYGCVFRFPEYDTEDAFDCLQYVFVPNKTKVLS